MHALFTYVSTRQDSDVDVVVDVDGDDDELECNLGTVFPLVNEQHKQLCNECIANKWYSFASSFFFSFHTKTKKTITRA